MATCENDKSGGVDGKILLFHPAFSKSATRHNMAQKWGWGMAKSAPLSIAPKPDDKTPSRISSKLAYVDDSWSYILQYYPTTVTEGIKAEEAWKVADQMKVDLLEFGTIHARLVWDVAVFLRKTGHNVRILGQRPNKNGEEPIYLAMPSDLEENFIAMAKLYEEGEVNGDSGQ